MDIGILSFAFKMVIFNSYVKLPEGTSKKNTIKPPLNHHFLMVIQDKTICKASSKSLWIRQKTGASSHATNFLQFLGLVITPFPAGRCGGCAS